jgi:hypothetical protein
MAKKRFTIERSGYAQANTNTEARQARREIDKATRGMTDEQRDAAILASPELSDLMEIAQRKPGNKTGPRPQGLSNYQVQKREHMLANGMEVRAPKEKKHEKNIDGLARKAIRTEQVHARGVDVVAAILSLSDEWEFRSGAPDKKISIGADNGHGKLRSVFLGIKGIPELPKSALSKSGESVILQRYGNPQDIVSIPCLTDQNQGQRGAGRKLSRQESEGIAEKIGIHPTELVARYKSQFSYDGPE